MPSDRSKYSRSLFEPSSPGWSKRATLGFLEAVLDPNPSAQIKNRYIHLLQSMVIRRILKGRVLSSALDFGCGTGRFSTLLAERADHAFSVDISWEMLTQMSQHQQQYETRPRACQFDGVHLPFPSASFDFILSVDVMQYSGRDPELLQALVSELGRVTRIGGQLCLLEHVDTTVPADRYVQICERQRFRLDQAYVIRRGSGSINLRLVELGWAPSPFLSLLALTELTVMRLRRLPLQPLSSYNEDVLLFRREPG